MKHLAIERILRQIEARSLDLTFPYDHWLKLAFAMASLGESGRSYFHRLSRFNADYDPAECDQKFTHCLESKGSGINLGTFFHLAREAGIPLSDPGDSGAAASGADIHDLDLDDLDLQDKAQKLPNLPEDIFDSLPDLLKKVIALAESNDERDVLLLGSITTLSSCLPTIYGVYDGLEVYSNLYLYITAAPSSGKGKLNLCKRLVLPIHKKKRKEAEEMKVLYDSVSAEGDEAAEMPEKPKEKMLLLPANSSATGVFQLLSDNEGRGLIFETEGDTLSNIFRSDYGNYSDGFRKCYHHETISFYRRTDREYVDIQSPCLSTVLSGTPEQVFGLIPSAGNGLFSRFLFYHLELNPTWKDTFRNNDRGDITDHYHHLGLDFTSFYELLCKQPPIQVVLSEEQKNAFYHFFRRIQGRYHALLDDVFVASVRRMGLSCYRIIMILSALRYQGADQMPFKIQCRDEDFRVALRIIKTLFRHSIHVYNTLPVKKEVDEKENLRLVLLRHLPASFNSKEFLDISGQLKVSRTSAYRILKLFLKEKLVIRKGRNEYFLKETQDLWGDQFSGEDHSSVQEDDEPQES